MSWTFVPSLIGCMLLMFAVVNFTGGRTSVGMVLLVLGLAFMAIWLMMMRREGRR